MKLTKNLFDTFTKSKKHHFHQSLSACSALRKKKVDVSKKNRKLGASSAINK